MSLAFLLIAFLTVATAAVAMALRNLVRSALLLGASWAGVAAFYLWAGAEFLAFAQVLVYVGAISMVVLFAVLLTRPSRDEGAVSPASAGRLLPALIAGGSVLGVLVGAIVGSPLRTAAKPPLAFTVRELGLQLMGPHAASLVVVGALLTVALLGAVVIAAPGRPGNREDPR